MEYALKKGRNGQGKREGGYKGRETRGRSQFCSVHGDEGGRGSRAEDPPNVSVEKPNILLLGKHRRRRTFNGG